MAFVTDSSGGVVRAGVEIRLNEGEDVGRALRRLRRHRDARANYRSAKYNTYYSSPGKRRRLADKHNHFMARLNQAYDSLEHGQIDEGEFEALGLGKPYQPKVVRNSHHGH